MIEVVASQEVILMEAMKNIYTKDFKDVEKTLS